MSRRRLGIAEDGLPVLEPVPGVITTDADAQLERAGSALLTRNQRARRTYDLLGVDYELDGL